MPLDSPDNRPQDAFLSRARWIVLILLPAGYWLTQALPIRYGWENGPIENTQVAVCLLGLLLALRFARTDRHLPDGWFWLIVIPFWAAFAARELSWGATLLPPLGFSEEFGPSFSSSVLPYRKFVTPVLALILLGCAALAVRHRLDRFLARLARSGRFPAAEGLLFVVAMLASATAEGHMGLSLGGDHAHAQIYEEFAELLAYVCLVLAQQRIHWALPHLPR